MLPLRLKRRLGKVNQYARAALGAEPVRLVAVTKAVRLEYVLAGEKDDVAGLRVREQVAVLGADGAVAAVDLLGAEVRQADGEADGAAVAVGLVRGEFLRFCHGELDLG